MGKGFEVSFVLWFFVCSIVFCLVVLWFELRASYLLGRYSYHLNHTPFALVIFKVGSHIHA
jgi:hypothetical protein